MKRVLWAVLVVWAGLVGAQAQELTALARLDPAASHVRDEGGGVDVRLAISQPVPWRVRVLDAPPRLVMDFREVDWAGLEGMARDDGIVTGLRAGVFRPGWSRLVMDLGQPMLVAQADMQTGEGAVVHVVLEPATAEAFAVKAAEPEPEGWALPKPVALEPVARRGEGPLIVVLDPGHGGIDPGAERDGTSEAKLMMIFARTLKEVLLRDGGFEVVLTREEDIFVPLETRISIAHQAGAQVFVSLHADALAEGEAVGATVYTLAEEANDKASATLAERHNRDDLLAGIDLSQQDDVVVQVLMDMARTETEPRTDRLADSLVEAIKAAGIKMHRRPPGGGVFGAEIAGYSGGAAGTGVPVFGWRPGAVDRQRMAADDGAGDSGWVEGLGRGWRGSSGAALRQCAGKRCLSRLRFDLCRKARV